LLSDTRSGAPVYRGVGGARSPAACRWPRPRRPVCHRPV